jgi:hypothetical protein
MMGRRKSEADAREADGGLFPPEHVAEDFWRAYKVALRRAENPRQAAYIAYCMIDFQFAVLYPLHKVEGLDG